jgi:preprotein translocase subunit SecF
MKIFEHIPHIDFMKYKALALAISWGIILACFVWIHPWKGADAHVKLGMQFTGGIDMMVAFKGDVHQDVLREALEKGGVQGAGVVAFNDRPGTSMFSIKVKSRKGQDEKDSSSQIKQITEVLKGMDAANSSDHRPDLNTESLGLILDTWVKTNPLGVQGDETAIRMAYEPWVDKVIKAREKFTPMTDYNQLPADLPAAMRSSLVKDYRLGTLAILKNESFSPSISGEWTWKTLKAVFYAMGAILLYVIFRFTLSFSVGGIVALIHDVLMALGLFVLFGFEFSVPVVASFLILIGYSMADTIVVFDRIRENSHKPEYRRVPIDKLVNDSINQTLSRTILTSLSVLFVAFCLLTWGGHALRDMSFPIFIGVITGTYSSIFIASPVVVYWDHFFGGKDKLKQHA